MGLATTFNITEALAKVKSIAPQALAVTKELQAVLADVEPFLPTSVAPALKDLEYFLSLAVKVEQAL